MEHKTANRRSRKPVRKAAPTGPPSTVEGEDAERNARERERLWSDIKDVPEARPPTKPP